MKFTRIFSRPNIILFPLFCFGIYCVGLVFDISRNTIRSRLLSGYRENENHRLLIYGNPTPPDRHSYTSILIDPDIGLCGGSLIADNAVLTSAFCAGLFSSVTVGIHDVSDSGYAAGGYEVGKILKTVVHPEYGGSKNGYKNDLAVLVLQTSIDGIRPVCMADSTLDNPSGKELYSLGWGITEAQDMSTVLQEAGVKYITNEECRDTTTDGDGSYGFRDIINVDTYMCASSSEGKGFCTGDTGGPLIEKGMGADEDVLVGVTSWNFKCGETSVYSRISAQRVWIDGVVAENGGVTRKDCPISGSTPQPSDQPTPRPDKKPVISGPISEPTPQPSYLPTPRTDKTPVISEPTSQPSYLPTTGLSKKPATSAGSCSVVDVGIRMDGQLKDCAEIGRRLDCASVRHLAACPNFCACSNRDLTRQTPEDETTECEATDYVNYYFSSRRISLCNTIVTLAPTRFCDYAEVRAYCPKACACWKS